MSDLETRWWQLAGRMHPTLPPVSRLHRVRERAAWFLLYLTRDPLRPWRWYER